jgi:hypothetical protein
MESIRELMKQVSYTLAMRCTCCELEDVAWMVEVSVHWNTQFIKNGATEMVHIRKCIITTKWCCNKKYAIRKKQAITKCTPKCDTIRTLKASKCDTEQGTKLFRWENSKTRYSTKKVKRTNIFILFMTARKLFLSLFKD